MFTELDKMRALSEAGYIYPKVWSKYEKCVKFIKNLSSCSCCWFGEDDLKNQIETFLKEIGEWKEKE